MSNCIPWQIVKYNYWCHNCTSFLLVKAIWYTKNPVSWLSIHSRRKQINDLHQNAEVHYSDVILSAMPSQITSISAFRSDVCSNTYQRKHQSSALQAFARRNHRWPEVSPHKGPVTRKCFIWWRPYGFGFACPVQYQKTSRSLHKSICNMDMPQTCDDHIKYWHNDTSHRCIGPLFMAR